MKLKLVIDTGTWMKFDALLEKQVIEQKFMELLYTSCDIIITHKIEEELIFHRVKSYDHQKTIILPIARDTAYKRAITDGFDHADSSILGIDGIEEYIVVSEDRPFIRYCKMYNLQIMFLSDFIWMMLTFHWLSKNKAYKIVKPLQSLRNITKNQHKRLLQRIRNF